MEMSIYSGYTPEGIEVICRIDPDKEEAVVEYDGRIRFVFHPAFPEDARACFEALCAVRAIMIEA